MTKYISNSVFLSNAMHNDVYKIYILGLLFSFRVYFQINPFTEFLQEFLKKKSAGQVWVELSLTSSSESLL